MSETRKQEQENLGAYNDDPTVETTAAAAPGDRSAAATGGTALTPEGIREALKAVVDPEIGLDLVNLGLIYNIRVEENNIDVEMTLTGPGCPVGPMLQSQVYGVCAGTPGARNVKVDLVWTPRGTPARWPAKKPKTSSGSGSPAAPPLVAAAPPSPFFSFPAAPPSASRR